MIARIALTFVPALLLAAPANAQDDVSAQFEAICGACHMPDGSGVPGLAPPLTDPAVWERLGDDAPAYVAGVILAGLSGTIEVGGQTYAGVVMPPHAQLSDEEIAGLGTYLLTVLNDTGLPLRSETVEAVRANTLTHSDLRAMREGEE